MSRLATTRRAVVWTLLGLAITGVGTGLNCPSGGPPNANPIVPVGNRPPWITITSINTPAGDGIAEQGQLVQIAFTGSDGEDTAIARVFASTSINPTPAEEIPILAGFAVGPGTANGLAVWDTATVPTNFYNIFAEIDDRTFDPFTGTGNPAVRVTSSLGVVVLPAGTVPTNGGPTIVPKLPNIDVGLTHQDLLVVRFDVTDPNADQDTLTMRILLDRDRDSTNDSGQPPIQIDTFTLGAGFTAPNVLVEQQRQIIIDLNQIPIRRETDAQGRPLPYFVRISADDGNGNVVNAYTSGALRLLSAANGVVDLLGTGGSIAGATFQGFGGHPTDPTRGDRAGSSFARLGDVDGDGIDDFAIVSESASPFGIQGAGHLYTIYGRSRVVNPDQPNSAFFQGRFSGLQSLNTVGTWVDFPPSDPRFRNFFKIRGQSMPHSHETGTGTPSLGITSVAGIPDLTGDGRPELIVGAPFTRGVADFVDVDPCDICRSSTNFTCLEVDRFRIANNALMGSVDDITAIPANQWAPIDPGNAGGSFPPNTELTLAGNERITQIFRVRVALTGQVPNTPAMATPSLSFEVQLENSCGPMIFVGPFPTEAGGSFVGDVYRADFTIEAPPPPRPDEFPVGLGQSFPPSIYDGQFAVFIRPNLAVQLSSIQVSVDCTVASSTTTPTIAAYRDGLPRPVSESAACASLEDGVNPFMLPFLVTSIFDPMTQGPACPPLNLALNALQSFVVGDAFGIMTGVYNQMLDGHRCATMNSIPGFFVNATGLVIDPSIGGYESGLVYFAASNQHLTTLDENGVWNRDGCPVQPVGQFGQIAGGCLNDSIRGGRFRGSWYNPDLINDGLGGPFPSAYDPTSLFGYTVDALPDINSIFSADSELLISAPGGAARETITVDLSSDLGGSYTAGTSRQTTFDIGTRFGRVLSAGLLISGTGTNLPRMRVSVNDSGGNPIPGADSTLLLWEGPTQDPDNNILRFRHFFGGRSDNAVPSLCFDYLFPFNGLAMRFPVVPEAEYGGQGLLALLGLPDFDQLLGDGVISLTLEILEDCTITNSSANITRAEFVIEGQVPGWGYAWLIEGQDYSVVNEILTQCSNALINVNPPPRAQSWPSTGCNTTLTPAPVRDYCYPQPLAYLVGEERGDAFGWARHAGDVNGDGVADIACGAPLSSNDPFNPDTIGCPCSPYDSVSQFACGPFVEPAPLQNNGKVYLIYGEAVFQNGPPCQYERLEIRGSHDGDQFGRVQGRAGDMNGDGLADMFFAAENYDAVGGIGGVQNRGVEAGFVGVLFGNYSLTGEIAINAEQVGTGSFKGVKFIGGSPGARLGGGFTSRTNQLLYPVMGMPDRRYEVLPSIVEYTQHGVSSAGDFNLDGFDDLLITAPGQEWPAAKLQFVGPVTDGTTVTINGRIFEFEISGGVGAGRTPVLISSTNPAAAQAAFFNVLETASTDETLNVAALTSRLDFPDPLPDIPTVTFLARRTTGFAVSSSSGSIVVTQVPRQGVAYVIFGGTNLENKTFYLPEDLNRRVNGGRILKGVVFVSAYEKGTQDEAPIEAVMGVGDVDGDGFRDIILGAPTADFINVLAPNQRRQSVGEAYLIYGSDFGLNHPTAP